MDKKKKIFVTIVIVNKYQNDVYIYIVYRYIPVINRNMMFKCVRHTEQNHNREGRLTRASRTCTLFLPPNLAFGVYDRMMRLNILNKIIFIIYISSVCN